MSSRDQDLEKKAPPVEGGEEVHDIDELEAVPEVTPEDLPGIAVHKPDEKSRRGNESKAGIFGKKHRRAIIIGSTVVAFTGVTVLVPVLWFQLNKLPDIRMLETYAPVQAIRIYDRFGKLAAVVSGNEDRRPIKLAHVSPNMRLAMIGAEDHDFYRHGGINPSSIMRALVANIQAGRIVEGGSTITQQLVKNLFFPGERRSFNRKIKEFFLANDVDRKYKKDQILEMYLNQIYFGNQSYGIESASQRYFEKPAAQLTLAESTFLAGLVRSPSYLSNPEHRDQAFARQHQVIDQMVSYGMISPAQAASAKAEKLHFRKFVNPYQKYPYYVAYVVDELRDHYGEQELQHGLNVYTCLDPQAQEAAEKAMNEGIAHAPAGVSQGALVSLRVNDGGVIALVGGVGKFEDHQWNRAVSPHTMGSAFKPFVYLTGLMRGLTPASIIPDTPFAAPSGGRMYAPRNFDNSFMGPLTLKMALTQSRNVCAVRVAWFAGIKNVIETAHLAGITSRLDPYLPTAVGACAASPLDMAGAYSTIARGGVYLSPHLVARVDSPQGRHIYRYDEKPRKVFDSHAVAELVECMENVVQHGTGIYGQLPGRPVAGKTGTADKSKDIWFCAFTPDICTTTWGGNDHNKAINNRSVTGGMVMAGMWKKYMTAYYAAHPTPPGSFLQPSSDSAAIAMSLDEARAAKSKGIVPIGAAIAGSADSKPKAQSDSSDGADIAGSDTQSDDARSAVTEPEPRSKRQRRYARKVQTGAAAAEKPAAPAAESQSAEKQAPDEKQQVEEKPEPKPEAKPQTDAAGGGGEAKPEQAVPSPRQQAVMPRQMQAVPRSVFVRMPNGQIYLVPVRQQPIAAPRVLTPQTVAPAAVPRTATPAPTAGAATPAQQAPATPSQSSEPSTGGDD